jgi:hypothetical protein
MWLFPHANFELYTNGALKKPYNQVKKPLKSSEDALKPREEAPKAK